MEVEFRKQDKDCTNVLKNHFEQNEYNGERLDRHREDINAANLAIKRMECHMKRMESKVMALEETIDTLEGVVENQQVVIARFRSCKCAKGVDGLDWD